MFFNENELPCLSRGRELIQNGMTYKKDRIGKCTNVEGKAPTTQAEYASILHQFEEDVSVGTHGSGIELLGKSMMTFFYDLESWTSGKTMNCSESTAQI